MITIDVQVGQKSFSNITQAFDFLGRYMETVFEGAAAPLSADLRRALQLVAKQMSEDHSRPWNGGVYNPSNNLQSRSGEGLASIKRSIRITGSTLDTVEGRISTGQMGIHETGGTIRAKSAGYLTIPLPAAMDSRGVPLRQRARDWDNTFVARSKKGNLIIFQKKGRKNITPLYLLKSEVYIRPRLGMERAIGEQAVPYFEQKSFETLSNQIDRMFQ